MNKEDGAKYEPFLFPKMNSRSGIYVLGCYHTNSANVDRTNERNSFAIIDNLNVKQIIIQMLYQIYFIK